jgi:hypothetical protein
MIGEPQGHQAILVAYENGNRMMIRTDKDPLPGRDEPVLLPRKKKEIHKGIVRHKIGVIGENDKILMGRADPFPEVIQADRGKTPRSLPRFSIAGIVAKGGVEMDRGAERIPSSLPGRRKCRKFFRKGGGYVLLFDFRGRTGTQCPYKKDINKAPHDLFLFFCFSLISP